jgi:hypothetical protein
MPKSPTPEVILAEHILEVRHAASGTFLDVRGYVADFVRTAGHFSHWKIGTDVVNFSDTESGVKKDGAFAGYKNAGYMVYNPDTHNYFVDKASAFWKTLQKNQHYQIPALTRFGARTKVFLPSPRSFEDISQDVSNLIYTNEARELVGGSLKDVQFIFDLRDQEFNVKIAGGPIDENEVRRYLSFEAEEFKHCGLFLDVDYSRTTNIAHADVPKLLRKATELTWGKVNKIAASLGL